MAYKIIGDSCLELTDELKAAPPVEIVPLTLQVGNEFFTDDTTFDQAHFLRSVRECPACPKSACPSPESFKAAFDGPEEDIFVITLSSHLSGSCNSARLARDLYAEEGGKKNILVIDSQSASCGETNLALYIRELYAKGLTFAEVSKKILSVRDNMHTYFVLDSLETLRKSGRLSAVRTLLANALSIKPVMGAEKGVIKQLGQTRGLFKALSRIAQTGAAEAIPEKMRAVIAHCNCPDRAAFVRDELQKLAVFREVVITQTAGVSTMYAGDGGIILAIG